MPGEWRPFFLLIIAASSQEHNHIFLHIKEVSSGVVVEMAVRVVSVQAGEGTTTMVAVGAGIAHISGPF